MVEKSASSAGSERASAYLAAIVASSDDAIIGKNLDGIITAWNLSAERIFGYTADEAIGRSITMLIPEERLKEEHSIISKIIRGERLEHFETVRRAKDGTLRDISITVSPIRSEDGTIVGASKVARDIGDRRRLEALAFSQKHALELALNGGALEEILTVLVRAAEANPASESCAAILLLDADGKHLRIGAAPSLPDTLRTRLDTIAVADSTGPSAEAVRTREDVFIRNVADIPVSDPVRSMVAKEGFRSCWSHPILSSRGVVLGTFSLYFRQQREPLRQEIETVETLANTAGIIVERDREVRIRLAAEASLRESEESWRTVTEAMPQLVWGTHTDGVCTYLSSQWTDYSGVPVASLLGYGWLDLLHPEDRERTRVAWEDAVAGRAEYDLDYRIRGADGHYRWFRVRGLPVRDEARNILKWYGTCTDIQELIESRDAAQEANIAKSDFLANMSHEIRTPMNAVFGLAGILARSKPLTAQQAEFIHTLQLSADALLALINDLLDIAKIEARTVELEHIPFDLDTLLKEIVNIMSVKAREKQLSFTASDAPIRGRRYVGDATRLRQIVMNLCSNAVKFTEAGEVHIAVDRRPGETPELEQVRIEVSDTGIGIAADKLDTIFQKFVQADNSINRKYGGTGLGLAIVKTLAELMGGSIEVSSTLAQGSRFTLVLPLRVDIAGTVENARPERVTASVAAPRRVRILLVEDYAPNVLVAKTVLDQFGYECDVAGNGLEAIEKVKKGGYALALMDVQMHGMNGLEATGRIREWEKEQGGRRLPIIGMTAHALAGDRDRCIAAGMDDYLAKPFNPESLEDILDEHIGGKEAA